MTMNGLPDFEGKTSQTHLLDSALPGLISTFHSSQEDFKSASVMPWNSSMTIHFLKAFL